MLLATGKINKSLKHDSWLVIVALTKQCITAAMLKGAVNPQNINVTLNTILNMKYNYLVQNIICGAEYYTPLLELFSGIIQTHDQSTFHNRYNFKLHDMENTNKYVHIKMIIQILLTIQLSLLA